MTNSEPSHTLTRVPNYSPKPDVDPLPSRMLKKSLFSPAQPKRAKTRFLPCGVLSSQESSIGTRPPHISAAHTNVVLLIRRTVRPRGYASGSCSACGLACGTARLGAPGLGG